MSERLTKRVGDGIRYDNGKYIITCYPKNNNLTPVDEMAAKLCDLEDKIESGTLVVVPYVGADLVCVVRCADCKHRPYHRCTRDNLWHDEDDFCSYGKRKE